MTRSWKDPVNASTATKHKVPDCWDQVGRGLVRIPPMGQTLAGQILKTKTVQTKDPVFERPGDKEASALNAKAYGCVATAVRALNESSLLLGSAAAILVKCGDEPKAPDMAELRRLHRELLHLAGDQAAMLGRTLAFQVCLERARWLDLDTTMQRKEYLTCKVEQRHLFAGALTKVAGILKEEEREGIQALRNRPKAFPRYRAKPYERPRDRGSGGRSAGPSTAAFRAPEPPRQAAPAATARQYRAAPPKRRDGRQRRAASARRDNSGGAKAGPGRRRGK